MPAGRKNLPFNIHVLNGTDRPCRRNEDEPQPELFDEVPQPPGYLTTSAVEEWLEMAPQLHRLGILTKFDLPAFEMYCNARGTAIDAINELKHSTLTITSDKGNELQNPLVAIINRSTEIAMKIASEFGMTPSSRTKLKVDPSVKKKNKFSDNAKKQAI